MNNNRVELRYFIVVVLMLQKQCMDINCNSIALPEENYAAEKSLIVPSCDCLGCDPCRPVIPSPPAQTPPCTTGCVPPPPPSTPPPMIIPLPPICVTTGFTSALTQLLETSCHDCSNPNCSSSPEGTSFPYPNHCQYFWKCQGGIATVCYCPNGTWFDRDRNCCNYCPNVTNCPANVN